ncbi:uncharacterized protein GGS25DRAFT_384953 [Hypoxylon fragiforme]|uniref:uncharacterized protein n=1 Tax=Hypoxylon fragiforme TaxID=63214 RepID=UPI0020C61CBF|nr:uncharacterized protein GGS25DRAFT_384953 [Hypoxylon fragiforme]KAI2606329.1 hypothetical protein GGS25DRAFT_384953 [Hypoxylon fragiforme]
MQSRSLLALLSALALSSASPIRRRCGNNTSPAPTNSTAPVSPAASSDAPATPALPSTGSGTQLDGPGTATLKHILIGHGIQNYTCSSTSSAATSIGALAVTWDITSLYPNTSPSSLSAADFSALSSKVLRTTPSPFDTPPSPPSSSSPFPPPADLTLDGTPEPLKFMGHHFFDAAGVPTFDLTAAPLLFRGHKDAGIPAPADADAGIEDPPTGAVDWLRLSDVGGSVGGASLVYRVYTAGGQPEACGEGEGEGEGGKVMSVPYAAQYWVYGN